MGGSVWSRWRFWFTASWYMHMYICICKYVNENANWQIVCVYMCIYKVHLYGTNMCNAWTVGFIFVELPIIHPINQTIANENSSVDQSQVISSRVYNKQHTRTHFQQKMSNTGSWYCELEQGTIKCTANHFNCPNKLSQNYPKIGIHWQFDQPPHPNLGSCCEVKPSFSFYIMSSWNSPLARVGLCSTSMEPSAVCPQFQAGNPSYYRNPTNGRTHLGLPAPVRLEWIVETIKTWKGNTAGRPSRDQQKWCLHIVYHLLFLV